MDFIPGKKYLHMDIMEKAHIVEFIKKNHESYTLLVRMPDGKEKWVVPKQLSELMGGPWG